MTNYKITIAVLMIATILAGETARVMDSKLVKRHPFGALDKIKEEVAVKAVVDDVKSNVSDAVVDIIGPAEA